MQVHEINFHGARLIGATADDGQVNIPIAPICAAIGLDTRSQRARIARDPVLKGGIMMLLPFGAGGPQNMLCVPLRRVNYWLAGIDTSRLKNAAMRDRVIEYQTECADVLCAHFMPEYAKAAGIRIAPFEARLLHDDLFARAEAPPAGKRHESHPFGFDPLEDMRPGDE